MSAKDKIEKGINYVIRFGVGLLGVLFIGFAIWGLSNSEPEAAGGLLGVLFIRYAIRGNKQKVPNKTKELIIKACEEGNIHYLKSTLNPLPGVTSGLDLNFIDEWKKQTPLDCAIENNFQDIATLLRKHGGKTKKELESPSKGVSAKKSKLPIPKWTITSVTGVAILFLMLAIFNGPNISIHQAVFDGNIEAVKQHLAAGTDVNAEDEDGDTPLHLATTKEIAELLIAKGADMHTKNYKKYTPLHSAVFYEGRNEIAELIIAKGADINAKDDLSRTPLDYAAGETADLLRKHGAKTGAELKAEGK